MPQVAGATVLSNPKPQRQAAREIPGNLAQVEANVWATIGHVALANAHARYVPPTLTITSNQPISDLFFREMGSILEPFCGHLSPKVDRIFQH